MTDDQLSIDVLESVRTIAVVGASNKPERASFRVMAFLKTCGYEVIPVNPALEGETLHGEQVVASLADIDKTVDMVDVFRRSDQAGEVIDEAIEIGAKAVWLQLGVDSPDAQKRAEDAGLKVVVNRCPKIDIPDLSINTPSSFNV
ncbi:CoA-binding protein [Neptuniibacter sp. PT34_22]|uniref:CoA-binding protein n=1 Tax=Neptuniibacter sp. PT34_22 TaxID=3398205 RepID=UPI0039F62A7D